MPEGKCFHQDLGSSLTISKPSVFTYKITLRGAMQFKWNKRDYSLYMSKDYIDFTSAD